MVSPVQPVKWLCKVRRLVQKLNNFAYFREIVSPFKGCSSAGLAGVQYMVRRPGAMPEGARGRGQGAGCGGAPRAAARYVAD